MKLSEQLRELIEQMKASDARLQAMTEEYITSTNDHLNQLKEAIKEE